MALPRLVTHTGFEQSRFAGAVVPFHVGAKGGHQATADLISAVPQVQIRQIHTPLMEAGRTYQSRNFLGLGGAPISVQVQLGAQNPLVVPQSNPPTGIRKPGIDHLRRCNTC